MSVVICASFYYDIFSFSTFGCFVKVKASSRKNYNSYSCFFSTNPVMPLVQQNLSNIDTQHITLFTDESWFHQESFTNQLDDVELTNAYFQQDSASSSSLLKLDMCKIVAIPILDLTSLDLFLSFLIYDILFSQFRCRS
jgi:hypothetical protein